MAMLSIRVDNDLRDELESWAKQAGISISELIRQKLALSSGRDLSVPMLQEPVRLTRSERAAWALKCDELAGQKDSDERERERFERLAAALRRGFTAEYQDLFSDIDPEFSQIDCRLVWDVLDMFRVIALNVNQLSESDMRQLGESRLLILRFTGFDMNDHREGRMLAYVQFLVEGGRWPEIRMRLEEVGDEGNSHMPMLQHYTRMLAVYQPLFHQKLRTQGLHSALKFSVNDLETIANATVQPTF